MIEIIDLHKKLSGKDVLKGVNLTVNRGETFVLIGASGKGKSVLLKHVIGLMEPDSGRILIDGQDINRLRGQKLKDLKNRLGIVFQFGALFDSLTVYENVAFPLIEKTKLKPPEIRERVSKELDAVGMKGEENKYPAQISGGMKKRAAVARCLVTSPEIILFDEPTTGLDPVMANSIYRIIKDLNKEHKLTSLIISHDIPEIFDVADRVAMLHDGKIIAIGTPEDIQHSTNPVVREFLSGGLNQRG